MRCLCPGAAPSYEGLERSEPPFYSPRPLDQAAKSCPQPVTYLWWPGHRPLVFTTLDRDEGVVRIAKHPQQASHIQGSTGFGPELIPVDPTRNVSPVLLAIAVLSYNGVALEVRSQESLQVRRHPVMVECCHNN